VARAYLSLSEIPFRPPLGKSKVRKLSAETRSWSSYRRPDPEHVKCLSTLSGGITIGSSVSAMVVFDETTWEMRMNRGLFICIY
jgi:hypothetical protein